MSGVVIVGTSVAGINCARSLRSKGYQGRILLAGEELEPPYDKPPLSKEFLAGDDEAAVRLLTQQDAGDAGIELLLGQQAVGLDVAEQAVEFSDHSPVRYDHLVIATGARARPSPWIVQSGVHTLRTLRDARRLRDDLRDGGPLIVVGAGFIGSEIASTARQLGLSVTIIDPTPVPMGRILKDEVGQWFAELHRRHGVATRFGVGVESVAGSAGALHVRLTDGEELTAATVVVGIGAIPNDGWLAGSGLTIDDGVVCDARSRAIGHQDVHAAGDVARFWHQGRQESVRIEHWTNAVDQAECVAHNISHPNDTRSFEPVGYVWSDQYDCRVQIAGDTTRAVFHEILGDVETGRFGVLYGDNSGTLCGALTVNWPRALADCRRALAVQMSLQDAKDGIAARQTRVVPG